MRRMCALLALALVAVWSTEANARGGNYRGPSGAVPPMLREPTDPVPPPPPPPVRRPIVVPPRAPAPTPPPPAPRGPSRPQPFVAMGFEDWRFWYHHGYELFEARPRRALDLAGDRALVAEKILPALLTVLDPKTGASQPVRSAAWIALAKTASTPEIVARIRRAAEASAEVAVNESAIVGLGLLRRTAKERQFDPAVLDAVRAQLLGILSSDERNARQRALAATALGLLGDQPTRSVAGPRVTTTKLFQQLARTHRNPDIPMSILLAIGLQPRESVTAEQRGVLREILAKGEVAGRRAYLGRAHAAITLGRIGDADDVPALLAALQDPKAKNQGGGRSAAIALGMLAPRIPAEQRAELEEELIKRLDPDPDAVPPIFAIVDATKRNLVVLTLARLAEPYLASPGLSDRIGRITEVLRTKVEAAQPVERPYAALALAQLGRAMLPSVTGPANRSIVRIAWHRSTASLLRVQMGNTELSPRLRGGFALALGMMRDAQARPLLLDQLQDRKQSWELRGACARALGLLGGGRSVVHEALSTALAERRSEAGRMDCSAALGLIAPAEAAPILFRELTQARSEHTKGTAAIALANLGARDHVAILARAAMNPGQDDLTRAMAVAALGRIGDPEPVPSLARFTTHMNWRANSDFLNVLFSLL